MVDMLRIMAWNANGLKKHQNELEVLLDLEKIDICLISETHFTRQSHIEFKYYNVYHTVHPSNCARGGSAIIVKKNIDQYEEPNISADIFQTTTITIKTKNQPLSITAIYCPPRYSISSGKFKELINMHKFKFIMGGDFNAKNTIWGSRLTTTKGRELYKAAQETGCEFLSTAKPTYWPTDVNKTPDLIDFFLVKKISHNYVQISEGTDLNSDHSPIYLTISEAIVEKDQPPTLYNKHTNWKFFKKVIQGNTCNNSSITTEEQLEVEVFKFTQDIQQAAWSSTPFLKKKVIGSNYPKEIKQLIARKRQLRRKWQHTRFPGDKATLNKASQELRREINNLKNESMSRYLSELTADKRNDYSLWKCTKYLKRPNCHVPPVKNANDTWTRSDKDKAITFANHLSNTFQPNESQSDDLYPSLDQETTIIPHITVSELKREIKQLKDKKAPGFDLITAEVLKQLPNKSLVKLANLFNSSIRLQYVPSLWKVAEMIMIAKPGKDPHIVSSYRPISLLPQISKLLEKLILNRLKPIIEFRNLIPSHQFGFRCKHSTIDQVHRITAEIEKSFEEKNICSAVFLDVAQAFDKVWHEGLINKLNSCLPLQYSAFMKSYITERYFRVKQGNEYSKLQKINAGVPQGSILGPLLYLIYTKDIPIPPSTMIATFADDTAILATGKTAEVAATKLQTAINAVEKWTKIWRIKLNSNKSIHVTFTNRKVNHHPIMLLGAPIPYANTAKYLGITLDAKLRWKEHIKIKRSELNLKILKMNWLIGRNSKLSIYNKIMIYNQIIKPVWSYGAQIWGCASQSNINIIQRFQNKIIKNIVNAPWYVRTADIHRDLCIPTVAEVIKIQAEAHSMRLQRHINEEASKLLNTAGLTRRLQRKKPYDLIGS